MPVNQRFTRRTLLAVVGAGVILAQAQQVHASTSPEYLGGSGNFTDSSFWLNGQTPTSSSDTVILFPGNGSAYPVQQNLTPFTLNQLLFTSGTNGSSVDISGGTFIFQQSSGTPLPAIVQQAGGPAVNISSQIEVDGARLTIRSDNALPGQGVNVLAPIMQLSSSTMTLLAIEGSGMTTLAGTGSDYTGGTWVTNSTVRVLSTSAMGPGLLMLDQSALDIPDASSVDISRLLTASSGTSTVTVAPTARLGIQGLGDDDPNAWMTSGNESLLLTGGGSIDLSGFNSNFRGQIVVEEETELMLKTTSAAYGANITVTSDASLNLAPYVNAPASSFYLGNGSVTLNGGSFNVNGQQATLGNLAVASGTLSVDPEGKIGLATLSRDPLLGSSGTASLLITGGGSVGLYGSSHLNPTDIVTVESGSELSLEYNATGINANVRVTSGASVDLDSNISGTIELRSVTLDGGSLNVNGTTSKTKDHLGFLQIGSTGTIALDGGGSFKTILKRDPLLGASGTASLLITGGGSVDLNGTSDFTSSDTITLESGAQLALRDAFSLGNAKFHVHSNATLLNTGTVALNSVTLDGGTLDSGIYSGTRVNKLLVGSSGTILVDERYYGNGNYIAGDLDINQLTRDPLLSSSGTASLLITGGGSVDIYGGPSGLTASDSITVDAGTDVRVGSASALGQAQLRVNTFGKLNIMSGTVALDSITLHDNGSLDTIGSSAATVNNLQISSSGTLYLGASGLTVNQLSEIPQSSGTAAPWLYARGGGSLTVEDASGFTGELYISEGSQAALSGASLSRVNLWEANIVFGGNNTSVVEQLTVASGATIAPGLFDSSASTPSEKAGRLTFEGGLAFSSGAIYQWHLGALDDDASGTAGADFDQLIVSGGVLELGPDFVLEIDLASIALDPDNSPQFWSQSRLWTIIDLEGTATNLEGLGSSALILPDGIDPDKHGVFSLQLGTGASLGDVQLVYTAVPEPTTLFMVALGGFGLLRRRRPS